MARETLQFTLQFVRCKTIQIAVKKSLTALMSLNEKSRYFHVPENEYITEVHIW